MNHHRPPLNVISVLHPLVMAGMQTLTEGLVVALMPRVVQGYHLAQGET